MARVGIGEHHDVELFLIPPQRQEPHGAAVALLVGLHPDDLPADGKPLTDLVVVDVHRVADALRVDHLGVARHRVVGDEGADRLGLDLQDGLLVEDELRELIDNLAGLLVTNHPGPLLGHDRVALVRWEIGPLARGNLQPAAVVVDLLQQGRGPRRHRRWSRRADLHQVVDHALEEMTGRLSSDFRPEGQGPDRLSRCGRNRCPGGCVGLTGGRQSGVPHGPVPSDLVGFQRAHLAARSRLRKNGPDCMRYRERS